MTLKNKIKETWFWIAAIPASCSGACGTIPTPTPAPAPDPGDYALVCKHLAYLGCPEGIAPECPVAFGRIQDGRLGDLQPGCLMGAQTPAEARACGSVMCEQ